MDYQFSNKESFKEELEKELSHSDEDNVDSIDNDCLIVKRANEWINEAKKRPIPKMLFGEFWFENELCILFSDTNLGKSILAVQICNSISKGNAINGFKLQKEASKVLYLDFELSDKQFEKRYSNHFEDHYQFDNKFLRAEINPEKTVPDRFKNFDEYIIYSIEKNIIKLNVKVLVIDNITYLRNDTEKAKDALHLMKQLNALKKKYDLSILVLAHTPKRDTTKAITKNDLSGSKMLMNFCDSSFAIGESFQIKGQRYLKQIKQRNTEHIYDTNNIVLCQIVNNFNFLEFQFLGFDSEFEHLKVIPQMQNEERTSKILELKEQGYSNVKIAEELDISEGTVRNILKKENK
ncbi:AAA family ATPase [Flavobacterium lacus]|uniref:Sigma-70-like protein n=1 Tax=Flavobacterium lacus TaxID=1353778 RepID=A0A328X712_9FLAO|nr:AAA family ATPase [Flavobacterium lacus]RAR51079.1 sigma-70-like protein [Flavobacterium lacus]